MYRSLAKECPWTEHLSSLLKIGVGALLSVSLFNHKKKKRPCCVYRDTMHQSK